MTDGSSALRLRPSKLEEIAPVLSTVVDEDPPAPWQDPPIRRGRTLFPDTHSTEDLQFFLVLGALNFSYWQWDGDSLTTWSVRIDRKETVRDVFALSWCLRGLNPGDLSAERLVSVEEEQVRGWFRDPVSGRTEIPMVKARVKKLRELGRGLRGFADENGTEPTLEALLRHSRTFSEVIDRLHRWFSYSFGDPLNKLAQLLIKMLVDRRSDRVAGNGPEPSDHYDALISLEGLENLQAQPDYMLPLFCVRTGLWSVDRDAIPALSGRRPLPWGHPLEQEVRRLTVETVRRLAEAIDRPSGWVRGRIDSVLWSTAVQGCFPVSCDDCTFRSTCDAVRGYNDRLDWDHHRTRTPYY